MFESVIQSLSAGLPVFLLHFIVTIAVLAVAVSIYVWITPHRELQLIREENNIAAAVSLSAAVLGLALPLAFCLSGSVGVWDIVLWGSCILCIQLITYFVIDRLLRGISGSIREQRLAPVIFLAAVKLAVAGINAAAIAE